MPVNKELLNFLMGYATDNKKELFAKALQWRTRHLTVIMENIYQSQNASAVLRTCECFGIQDVHFITEMYGTFKKNVKVTKGATKWINIYEYEQAENCFDTIRQKGYKIVATSPKATMTLDELALDQKVAFLFGEERNGLSDEAIAQADELIRIPMFGFTESFNISVSAAICLQNSLVKLHASDYNWQLSDMEKDELLMDWVVKSIRSPEALIKYFHKQLEEQKSEG